MLKFLEFYFWCKRELLKKSIELMIIRLKDKDINDIVIKLKG